MTLLPGMSQIEWTSLTLILDGDNCWPELAAGGTKVIDTGARLRIARLRGGMTSGADALIIRLDLPDGTVAIAQTSLAAFTAAAQALEAAVAGEIERGERPLDPRPPDPPPRPPGRPQG